MFAVGDENDPYPGIAVEMEWNNKDPFFDRDLINFAALHREGRAIAFEHESWGRFDRVED